MAHQVTLGGNRLGAGKQQKVTLHGFERSTFDLSYVWRSTMAAGTLVPFMTEVALPGDTFDIRTNVDVLTHPTIGPLFGTYKIQLDIFQVPIRLYQGKLHMNMINIGRDMSAVKIPQIQIWANPIDFTKPIDNQQINPSSIFSYLGIRGLGQDAVAPTTTEVNRRFNAIPFLGYWDIYKQYYANKQEEIGAVIHHDPIPSGVTLTAPATLTNTLPLGTINLPVYTGGPVVVAGEGTLTAASTLLFTGTGFTEDMDTSIFFMGVQLPDLAIPWVARATDVFTQVEIDVVAGTVLFSAPYALGLVAPKGWGQVAYADIPGIEAQNTEPEMVTFPLSNIDDMKMAILKAVDDPNEFLISSASPAPYGLPFQQTTGAIPNVYSKDFGQEGLACKTYNSDLFNNWISTEWIDGPNGISEVTAIDTSAGSFTIDELNMSKKVYMMLNRIAMSGGSYYDWLDAVWEEKGSRGVETPVYLGGHMRNLMFQEVVSNSAAYTANGRQPLGTLAGRGTIGDMDKGGTVVVKVDEPSYIMGIVSLTPNVDYSQGNKWDTQLLTMNDFHKPSLDEIGFQDLVTDQMAWFDTEVTGGRPIYKSAGKVPAWLNYMTNVDVVKGNFAEASQQMFMVLNRRYNMEQLAGGHATIKDLTTYIDPSKFNHIFADTRRDAQNFWTQIGVNITARRKMSSKVMPNL